MPAPHPNGRVPGGPRGGKLPKALVREREKRVWELRMRGLGQIAIAHELNATELGPITDEGVRLIIKRVEKRYLDQIHQDVEREKVRQHARLLYVYKEAIEEWHKSKNKTRKVNVKTIAPEELPPGTVGITGTKRKETTVEEVERHGDPRYLNTALKALEDIRKVYGIDAPTEVNVHGKSTQQIVAYTIVAPPVPAPAIEAQVIEAVSIPPPPAPAALEPPQEGAG